MVAAPPARLYHPRTITPALGPVNLRRGFGADGVGPYATMLQAIRTKAGSIIVKVLFALLIVSFGFWGIYTRSPYYQSKSPDTAIATVGGDTIRVQDLQEVLQPAVEQLSNQLGTTIDRQQMKQLGIVDTLLGQLVDRSLLDQEAQRLGLEVSDTVVRDAIAGNPMFRDPDGRFDRDRFNQILAANHLSEDQFVAKMRDQIPRSDLLIAITTGVTPSPDVVDALYRYRNETRTADIVSLPVSAATGVGQPSEADLTKFYDAHHDLFQAPEYRGFTLVSLTAADLAAGIKVPDDKLRAEYAERKGDFAIPEQRDIQQILAPSEAKAKAAQAALAAGKDWNQVATTIVGQSPDTIEIGLMQRSEMPKVLADAAFSLPLNQPSQPIQTSLGWHILRVVKIVPASTASFADAKPKLTAEFARNEALDRLDTIGNKADDALAGGATLAQVAAKFGLKTTVVKAADVGGRDPDGKPIALPINSPQVLKTLFATDQGEISRVINTEDGTIFALRTDKITPPQVRPLAAVKAKASAGWQQEQKRAAVANEAKALAAAVSPSNPLKAAAAAKKLAATASPPLSRQAAPDGPVPPALVAKLFSAKQGQVVTAEDARGAYVAQLTQIKDPGAPSKAAAAALANALTGASRLDFAAEFTAGLRNRFPVKIDQQEVDRAF